MKIIIDAMGGDRAPDEIVKGAALASREYDVSLVLVGDEKRINELLSETEADLSKISVVHADSVITMEDDPVSVVRAKKDSSMSVGLKLLKEDGDAFVSAGNTGALQVGGSLIVRTLDGVDRAAIATILPFRKPMLFMDSGANVTVQPSYYRSWAVMGSVYMKNVMGVDSPTVGMLNNGTEEHKGTPVEQEAYKLLSDDENISFVGNIEGKELMSSPCDVLVTDGFTGNIVIKTIEGMSKFFMSKLKDVFLSDLLTKIAYLIVKKPIYALKSAFDASEYGGAPLLGLKKPVFKAHGSSDALAIKNAVRQAIRFVETDVNGKIGASLAESKTE